MSRLIILLCIALGVAGDARAAELSEAERQVWALEEAYWQFVQAGDVESYVKLWHEDFVGWPCHSKTPADKSQIGTWVREIRDHGWKFSYQLQPKAFRVFDDVVVVHYSAEYVYDYGDGTTSGAGVWRKFVHAWQRTGDGWQIITGMCAAEAPVSAPRS